MKLWQLIWALVCATLAQAAVAQAYPSKLIKLVNPYAAGGSADLMARDVAKPLGDVLGQQIVIENRPGGGATIGADYVAKSAPDGYTLLLSSSQSHTIVPAMQDRPLYDGIKDFTPIAMIAMMPNVIVVKPSLPVNSLESLIDYAKANPGKLFYGSPGVGSIGHLSVEMLKGMTGVTSMGMVHVPYKGGDPARADLLGGRIDFLMMTIAPVMPHIKSGKMRALAVSTKKRSELLPDLPTIDESGVRGFDAGTWFGIFGPAKLPAPIVMILYQGIRKVMNSPDLKARMQDQQGAEVTVLAAADFLARMQKEQRDLAPIIKGLGLKVE